MQNCIFCKVAKGEAPSWTIYENESTYAYLDINPVSRYHTLVIPKKHYQDIFDIEEADLQDLIATVKKVSTYYKEHLGLEDIQIISNSGAAAQQTVFHLHFHIVPRHHGDNLDIVWRTHREWRVDFDKMLESVTIN